MSNQYLDLLQSTSLATGSAAAPNPYLDMLQADAEARKAQQIAQLSQAVKINPEQYSAQRRVAGYLGYPVAAVEMQPSLADQAKVKQVQQNIAGAPVLQQRYTDADFAKLAHDDSSTLATLETAVGKAVRYVMGAAPGGGLAGDLEASLYRSAGAVAGVKRAGMDVIEPWARLVVGDDNWFARMSKYYAGQGQAAEEMVKRLSPPTDSTFGSGVSAGVQSFGQNAKYLPLALAGPGGGVLALAGMVGESFGASYNKAADKNLPLWQSLGYASADAMVEYWTEKLPMDKLIGGIQQGAPFLKTFAKQLGYEIPGEQLATVLQDLNEWATLNPQKSFKDYLAERPDAAVQTLIATVIGTGGNVMVTSSIGNVLDTIGGTQWRNNLTQGYGEMLQEQLRLAGQSALRERSPEQFRALVQQITDGNPGAPKSVYVDGEVLQQLPAEVFNQLPSAVQAQIPDAAATGGVVEIPMADVLTLAPGTELEQVLNQHARMDPFAQSQAEAQASAQQAQVFLQQEAQRVIAQAADQEALRQSQEAVKTNIQQQLAATGRFRDAVNEGYATWAAAFYTAYGSRLGMTPEQFYAKYPLRVLGAPVGQQTGVLNAEADFFNQEGRLMGINVRSDTAAGMPYADAIVDGMKLYETRDNDSLRPYVGQRVAIVRTGEGQAKAIGEVTIGEPILVDEARFRELQDQHLVSPGSAFDIAPGGQKYLYPMQDAVRYDAERDVGAGIVSRQVLNQAARVTTGRPIFQDIITALGLTDQEVNSTVIEYMTGLPGDMAFLPPAVGGLADVVEFLHRRRMESGLPALDIAKPEDRAQLARLVAAEALAAIRNAGDSLEWYDTTVSKTLALMALKYPELNTDANARTAFLITTAIASQGLNVEDNLAFASEQYEAFRAEVAAGRTGKFPIIGKGESAGAMEANFQKANDLLEEMGPDLLRRFLATPFTVRELETAGFTIGGENMDTMVLGSAVFGPKIGFGFYSNLNGNFEPVTMDMWFMRTIGRLAGTLPAFDQAKYDKQVKRFRDALKERGAKARGLYASQFDKALVTAAKTDDGKMIELARLVKKAHEKDFKTNRAKFDDKTRVKTDLVAAAETILFSLEKPRDVPASGGERNQLRDVVSQVVDIVAQNYGDRVPPAALQALIWYPEQEFYKAMGVKLRVTSQDYAGAARKLLEGEGFNGQQLDAAAESGSRLVRPADGQADAGAVQGNDQGVGRARPLEADERTRFLVERNARIVAEQRAAAARIAFEVAPDPNDAALTDRWRQLTQPQRLAISDRVARAIVPKVLKFLKTKGEVLAQVGSYLEDTNPSFALRVDKGDVDQLSKILGFVLSQDSMMAIAPAEFPGSFKAQALRIEVGEKTPAEVDQIYQSLRAITLPDGRQPIAGQSTSGGAMTVLLDSQDDANVIATLVDQALAGAYNVGIAEVFAAFPEKQDYDYARVQDDPAGDEGLARQRARAARQEASDLLRKELDSEQAAAPAAGPLQQQAVLEQGARGTFNPQTLELVLNPNADLSTWFHETGHFFLEVLADVASQPGAPAQIVDDYNKVLAWFGVTPQQWAGFSLDEKRPYHERWAESIEQYVMEGKAPSVELQGVMRRFRAWMTSVYQSIKAFVAGKPELELNDDIRRVMDRMLATDEQIAQANEVAGFMPNEDADGEAAERLQKRSMADLKWAVRARDKVIAKLKKQAREVEKAIREQVTVEVDQMPEMRAKAALDALAITPEYAGLLAEHKAQRQAAEAQVRKEITDAALAAEEAKGGELKGLKKGQFLAKMKREIGNQVEARMIEWDRANPRPARPVNATDQDVATIADSFGFESVEAMMQAIDAFGKRADAIDGLTEQRMLEENGDLIDERAIQEAANEAVHNEARARSLATELRTQREMLGQRTDTGEVNAKGARITVNTLVEAAKQFGARVVARTPLKDLKATAWKHTAAERRAGKRWAEATAKGETQEAVQAKQDQVLNNAAAKAAIDAATEAKKILEFFRRVTKGNDEKTVEKGRDPDIVNAARAVLAAYGVETPTTKAAAAYLEVLQRNDPETYAALEPMVAAATANAQPLQALTFEELQGLAESIQAMWHLAKRSRQMEVDGNLLDIDEVADEVYARLETIGIPDRVPGEGMAVTQGEERTLFLQQGLAFLRRVEQWAEGMDGKYGGPFLRYIFQPIKDAADRYRKDRIAYRKKFQALVDNLAPIVGDSVIAAPELGYTFGTPGSTAGTAMNEILHAIAHTGNDSNKRKLLLGRDWATENPDGTLDTSRWDAFIRRLVNEGKLEQAHFDFVQGVWDLLEETKPLAQKAHRDAFGRYFSEVTANAFVDPFGVTRRGGYVPAQVDSRQVKDNALRKLAEEENNSMAYAFPQPAMGFTKSRTEYNKPLMLDLRTLSQHLDKVLLFGHMTNPARDVRKLLMRPKVNQPLNRVQPAAVESMLQPWLQRSAQQIVEDPIVGSGKWARIPGIVRSRAGMALMFANVSNAIQQVTGVVGAAVRVKPGYLMRSLAQYVSNPAKFSQAVWAASPYMDDRAKNEVAVMNEQMQAILIQPGTFERVQDFSMRHAYFLQTALDNVLSPIVWTGALNQALADGMSQADAIRFADSTVRQTQGSTLPEDVSRFETGPAYARAFTQFVGYFNMMANTNGTALKQIAGEVGLKKGAGKALYVVMMGMMVPIWIAEAIALAFKGGPEDEEGDGWLDDWLAAVFGMGTTKGLLAQIPIVGQFGVAAANRFNDNPLDDRVSLSPAISLLESSVSAPQSVYKAIVEDGSAQKAIRDVSTLVSVATGVPVYGLARPIGYAAGVAQGKIEPTGPVDAARGLVTGTASPESKQR